MAFDRIRTFELLGKLRCHPLLHHISGPLKIIMWIRLTVDVPDHDQNNHYDKDYYLLAAVASTQKHIVVINVVILVISFIIIININFTKITIIITVIDDAHKFFRFCSSVIAQELTEEMPTEGSKRSILTLDRPYTGM